ncbi:MAG: hypothetical protein WD060_11475 [Pirellulales bacterium]
MGFFLAGSEDLVVFAGREDFVVFARDFVALPEHPTAVKSIAVSQTLRRMRLFPQIAISHARRHAAADSPEIVSGNGGG